MKHRIHATRPGGFSLLEVLLAVVVLSFGLLALAALQGSLFKASTETKAQTVGLALAQEKLEYFRGFKDIAAYQAITSGADAAALSVGGVDYTRNWTVTRYAYPNAGGDFVLLGTNTGPTPNGYVSNNEFKRVLVNVTWTDAQGASQRVSLEEAIAAIDPSDSAKLGKLTGGTRPRGPEVRIYNPTNQQQGVIPIAIGNGTDTAATNPKPLVNGNSVVETRFDVLTYNDATSDGTAQAQARVETSLVACSCDYGNAPESGAKRPSYWDGTRYTVPEDATAVVGASYVPEAGPDASASAQSALCTICCRDHHDPSTLPAGSAKFDPRNTGHASGHFLVDSSDGSLSAQRTSGKYTEACRVIRVGGLFRVAADTYDDYQNFLETKNDSSTTAYLPTSDSTKVCKPGNATVCYQNFVKAYLDSRIVNQSTMSAWNNVLPVTSPGTVTTLETANSIYATQPDAITFQQNDPAKWLHLRGLYIDYLEDKALQAIEDAKDSCTAAGGGAPTTTDLESCVFKVLPFTSINLTELGNYQPGSGTQIVVAMNNFADTLSSTAPVRGKVTLGSNPTTGQTTDATAVMRRSNSGLTTLIGGIDTDDAGSTAPSTWTATQPYTVQGAGSGGGGTGGSFTVNLSGYTYSSGNLSKQYISVSPSATCNAGASGNPWTCTSSTLGVAQVLTLGNYNYSTPLTEGGLTLDCTDSTGTTAPHTFAANGQGVQTINVCKNFQVDAGSYSSALPSPSDGPVGETTPVTFTTVNNGDVLTINMSSQTDTRSYTCTLPAGGTATKDKDYVVAAAACP